MNDKQLILFPALLSVIVVIITFLILQKLEPQIINTYDSELVDMSISYKDDTYYVDIEKYNKHFSVNEKDTKIIVYYEDKAIVEEYDDGSVKIYFYLEMD